ncbi:ketopantoate reductase family protein [Jeotgalibacillus sp. S-D1]|uniref:ketopantoate reductase family protein n=1 Tax=Jeotgalibacillus sp. S-D1 TaxID=2552189 RepID=UPI001059FE3D|nr:ketopantoate reductase family protein [Jeotgalibacillus sp. S-D1]TDL31476.1 ketopantoate reductase family protein [Jeotgalibacillus sp. S-D1]
MKILVVGAGAIGGYFGGRLAEKGEDVTFLVRENRKNQLLKTGLQIKSIHGDFSVTPKLMTSEETGELFDVVLLTTKSYQLNGAINDIKPFVGEHTMILPLLNGIAHVDELIQAFGDEAVLGGLCFIETTLDSEGTIVQSSPIHDLLFGERSGNKSERILKLQAAFSDTRASFRLSENINQDMWHKYSFISALSGVTTLMRAPIGPIREQEAGYRTIDTLLKEISMVMKKMEAPIKDNLPQIQLEKMMEMGHSMKSSMQRDMEKSCSTEVDHLQGYLLEKAKQYQLNVPVLDAVYTNVKVYEKQL